MPFSDLAVRQTIRTDFTSISALGRQLIELGSQYSYTRVEPNEEVEVKEIIHNCHDNSHDKGLLLIYVN